MKIRTLSEEVWEGRVKRQHLDQWLENFQEKNSDGLDERLTALFLLSQFMYFGAREVRALLAALYRDLYKYPIVAALRRGNNDTTDRAWLARGFKVELAYTRFLAVGNPSESGQHLLYYFRQENSLPKELFINAHEIFSREGVAGRAIADPQVTRYVFLDDFCGSGTQARRYSRDIVEELKHLQPGAAVYYYSLFATDTGQQEVKRATLFDHVESVFTLDESYKTFGPESRYFVPGSTTCVIGDAESICRAYGHKLYRQHPLGYKDGQLLIGFMHNVPDNTLPVIWAHGSTIQPWHPIFRRYPKLEA